MKNVSKKAKAALFYYFIRPYYNAHMKDHELIECPVCGKLLQYYEKEGFLHLSDGDADCYGALGKGKGN